MKREVAAREQRRATYLEMARQTPKLIVAGLRSSWDDGLPFERFVYHQTKLGLGIDAAQFTRLAPTISRRQREYVIWLMGSIEPRVMVAFERDWHRAQRTIWGKTYEVWIPNSAAVSN